ncbi:hypothetical protein GQ53DRAFT_760564 [Thozetella sp. PMI_491]|nr:hypothetical protein GQ53DRAFT_760564 [Thozetella sp. PMI_491]
MTTFTRRQRRNTNGWLILETVNGNGVTFKTTTTRAHSGQYSMDIMPNYYNNWAPQSITVGTYLATVPGTVYALSFWLWTGGWTFHSAGINGRTFMTDDKGIDSWTQYNTTFTAVGQDLMTITASAGDWQYAELFLDDFAAVPAS